MTQVISQRETLPCAMVSTKYKKKPGNWGTVEFRNYSEITPKLGNRGIPKLLRNYSEITPKLWDWDRGRGTMELLRNYSEIGDRGTMELLRNYSEIEDRGTPKLWNSETMGLGVGPWPWNYGITPKLLRNWGPGS